MNALPHHLTDDQFSAYLDGQLPAGEQARVDAHLAACPACAAELRGWHATVGLLREMPPAPLPRAFTIPASALHKPAWRDRLAWGWGYRALQGATAVAAMLLLTLCGWDLLLQAPAVMTPMALAPAPAVEQTFGMVAPTDTPATTSHQALAPTRAPEPSSEAAVQSTALNTATPAPPGPAAQPTAVPAPSAKGVGGGAAPSPTLAEGVAASPPPTPEEREAPTANAASSATPAPSPTAEPPSADYARGSATPQPAITALAYYSPPSPVPLPGESANAVPASAPQFAPRLVVCGIEGVLVTVVVGLFVVTGWAWLARRRDKSKM
ncbi:MAG: zf-HC2 domain-containing protein [Chloroflexi bacterium]|nr:zf-HC2 domain-containing protein [Chloroflexota bacterium]MBU1750405.1 zf-HC2 domain-containing protein [Chloroflexota bacterium]